MELIIRLATIGDYDGVALIFDEIDQLHRQALPHIFRAVAGRALERAHFEAVLATRRRIGCSRSALARYSASPACVFCTRPTGQF